MSKPNPALNDEPSVLDLVRGLTSAFFAVIRENRIAAAMAVAAGILTSFLAFTMRYDERPRFREIHLPTIEKAEAGFSSIMKSAENAPNDTWRLYYFLSAHMKVPEVVRRIQDQRPSTAEGRAAHDELIRYYKLVDEEISIIRTQMSINDDLDYWGEWKREQARLEPVRAKWINWLQAN